MRRIINYLFLIFIFSFMFLVNANAECSYQERKQLLNDTKSVDISYEIKTKKVKEQIINNKTGKIEDTETEKYYIVFYVTNVIDSFFVKVWNSLNAQEDFYINSIDLIDGVYMFESNNITEIVKYNFDFYSNNKSCLGTRINTKTILKPRINYLYDLEICKKDENVDSKYCKQFITEEFDQSYAMNKLSNIIINNDKDDKTENNIFLNYWYIWLSIIFVVIILMILKFRRKKYEL